MIKRKSYDKEFKLYAVKFVEKKVKEFQKQLES